MSRKILIPSPLQAIMIADRQIFVKREDLIHPYLSGNKYRKLKYNIIHALEHKYSRIISFGGAFSNHIHALGFACQYNNIPLTLYIRGEDIENPTLNYVKETGASIHFISRSTYRQKNSKEFLDEIKKKYPNSLIIPEGGSNEIALEGLEEMMAEIYSELACSKINFCVSYGSGGTSIGMMKSIREGDKLNVFPALKMKDFTSEFLNQSSILKTQAQHYELHPNYHFGGYAKYNKALIDFINEFKLEHQITLDPIYNGKMFFAAVDLIKRGHFNTNEAIVLVHTGGLQGIQGFNQRFGNILQ